jgi:PAS domain S-box-containing protein
MGVIDTINNNIKEDIFNLEHFFNLSPDLLCIAGFDGYFKKINPAVSKTLGYTNEELFSRPIDSFVHAEDRELTSQKRENIKKDNPLLHFENRYITKSGEIVWLSWTSMPIKEEGLVFAIAKVVTHKKKLEEDRNSLLNNLTSINNELKQLTYTTSHNLRLPVSNLLSIFNFLDISKIQDKETLEFFEMLKISAESLKNTLNDYVDTLTQKNILEVHTEELNLSECLNTVLLSLGSLIQGAKAKIAVDFSVYETINFNKAYLESIFLNLITNSIKYTKPDTAPVITIYTRERDNIKQLVLSDKGLGFDMDAVKDKIFGFNQKFHNHSDSKGIGLYLVYNHVTSLGGKIAIESRVNEGATFIISFPKSF